MAGGKGAGEEWLLSGYRIFIWDDEKVLELDSSDHCTILWVYFMPLMNCAFLNGYDVELYVIHIYPPKKLRFQTNWFDSSNYFKSINIYWAPTMS